MCNAISVNKGNKTKKKNRKCIIAIDNKKNIISSAVIPEKVGHWHIVIVIHLRIKIYFYYEYKILKNKLFVIPIHKKKISSIHLINIFNFFNDFF